MRGKLPMGTQLGLLEKEHKTISLPIDPGHQLVSLTDAMDWEALVQIAENIRQTKIKANCGVRPHMRTNLGAVVLRSMKSCDLRTAEDLIKNYVPARYMCELHLSRNNLDHNTLWDFEEMLGESGLALINEHVLKKAHGMGFADVRGLCSDTTAQEGRIPYPNEVGLMGSFARSVGKSFEKIKSSLGGAASSVKEALQSIKEKVKEYRLFAKTKEAKEKLIKKLHVQTGQLVEQVKAGIEKAAGQKESMKMGAKKALVNLEKVSGTMEKLLPQIEHWIRTGIVATGKIVSLFIEELRSIPRGKVGKPTEFGLKWGINHIRGGYVQIFQMPGSETNPKQNLKHDSEYAVHAVKEHIRVFGEAPEELSYDRGGWSPDRLEEIEKLGVKRLAVAPKGKAKWLVSKSCQERAKTHRAQVEGKIGNLKAYEFSKPRALKRCSMARAARRSELRSNLTRFFKDINTMNAPYMGTV
jgi:hypothetical protein